MSLGISSKFLGMVPKRFEALTKLIMTKIEKLLVATVVMGVIGLFVLICTWNPDEKMFSHIDPGVSYTVEKIEDGVVISISDSYSVWPHSDIRVRSAISVEKLSMLSPGDRFMVTERIDNRTPFLKDYIRKM